MEEIGEAIGYTATNLLVDWFGGNNIRVPLTVESDHPIAQIIGEPAYRRLVKFMDERALTNRDRLLWIPLGYAREVDRRDRMIVALYVLGLPTKEIATIAGMTERHVQTVRVAAEERGLMPLILGKMRVTDEGEWKSGENRQTKGRGRK